jgi:hypothetical protein
MFDDKTIRLADRQAIMRQNLESAIDRLRHVREWRNNWESRCGTEPIEVSDSRRNNAEVSSEVGKYVGGGDEDDEGVLDHAGEVAAALNHPLIGQYWDQSVSEPMIFAARQSPKGSSPLAVQETGQPNGGQWQAEITG